MAQGVKHYFDLKDGSYGITFRVHYSQIYDIDTNKSVVAISQIQVMCSAYYGITHYLDGTIKIDGTTAVSASSTDGTNAVTISKKNEFYSVGGKLGSVTVAHADDGSKSVTIAVSIKGVHPTSGTKWSVSGSKTIELTEIPRASVLTVKDGTLGTKQVITAVKKKDTFSHSITYTCGTASGTICTKSQAESFEFTPPIELASQNTTGTSVTVKFTLQTYSGEIPIASPVSVTVAMAIPASVKPSCSLTITDAMGYLATFGGYVQGQSKLNVNINGTKAYGAEIASYKATANGATYTQQSFVTEVLTASGEQAVSATVTDKRGRTSENTVETITVLAYSLPRITALAVHRCNEDGTENSLGSFAKVTYSFEITSLSNLNAKNITLKYKKSAEAEYTSVALDSVYIAENAEYVFAADDGSSYDIILVVEDSFTGNLSSTRNTSVSTADVILHFRADAKGIGAGKVSEKANALDMGWDIELNDHNLLKNGVPLNAEHVGARPNTWLPTAADIGAAPAGYGLGTTSPFREIATAAELNQFTMNGTYAIHCVSPLVIGWWSIEWFTVRVTNWDAETLVHELYINGQSFVLRRICDHNSWGEYEWINPPMTVGVEYRTTERYNGLPVYRKLIKYTNTTTMGNISGSADYNIPHGISGFSELVELNARYGTHTMIPYPTYKTISGTVYASVSGVTVVSDTNIVMRITNDTFSPAGWFFSLAYTKS